MRKVILQEFLTLDGLAAGQNDSVDFVPASTRETSVPKQGQSLWYEVAGSEIFRAGCGATQVQSGC